MELAKALAKTVFDPAGLSSVRLAKEPGELTDVQMKSAPDYHPAWVYYGLIVGTVTDAVKTILEILKKAGGWHPGLYLKIDNPHFMELVIEATDESGPCGLPAITGRHYGKLNGDTMRDPEMLFEVSTWGLLTPFYWRNDYAGIEQWSRFIKGDNYCFHTELFHQHEAFAKLWDKNLRAQGSADAFDTAKHIRG